VRTFLDEVPDRLAAIRVALVGGDGQELRSAAHALGSPAAMLGAVGVSRASKLVQAAGLEERMGDAVALVDDLESVTRRTEDAMRTYLADSSAS
jgi:HPt (histidine-containing phosphotransfer) domain-containing protein